ncbi:helix-turn-helix domain-containing protein [Sphingomonas sp.]|uniref:helix-turn-helix transcriptional regulator n=1 Tax=Sphingomonas sp. TaxID=28214 RepID=UPI0035BBF42B
MYHAQVAELSQPRDVTIGRDRSWRISGMESCRAPRTTIEPPDAALAHLLTRYESWSPPAPRDVPEEHQRALWVLPGEARLVVVCAGGQVSAMIGNRRYDGLPQVVLFGPTSRATRLVSTGPRVVTIGLSALGWAMLVARSAAALGDRAVPAADVLDVRLVAALAEAIQGAEDEGVADRIDAVVATATCAQLADEALVRGLAAIIDKGVVCVAEAAGVELGVASHVVRRSALRHFGYPPKVLLNRRRFVRALERMVLSDRGYSEAARHGYFDASHFIRDAKRFLGMTPRRFLALAS